MKLLLIAIAAEIVIFTAIAPNFLTTGNLFEITRLSVELGLLAIALTPILVTGGIDLSVGSMMGLAAVVFGIAATDWHLPIVVAAATGLPLNVPPWPSAPGRRASNWSMTSARPPNAARG